MLVDLIMSFVWGKRRKIVGWIDALSGQDVRGWAAVVHDLDATLMLEAFLDGQSVGTARADEFRVDLTEKGYGHGRLAHPSPFTNPRGIGSGDCGLR